MTPTSTNELIAASELSRVLGLTDTADTLLLEAWLSYDEVEPECAGTDCRKNEPELRVA